MLHERDPNVSGRTSRGSSMSAVSRAPSRPPPGVPKPNVAPSALPGVMSMLRTSTEMGNVAGVTGDVSGMGSMPRPPQRFGTSSRLSTASSLSNHSSRASRHPRDYHLHTSAPRYGPMRDHNAPQYMPDTLSPTTFNIPASSPRTARRARMRDGHRSRSLTNPMHAGYALSSNRSLGSLRPVPEQRPRSPYYNHGRSQRPYHRSASPGSSDYPGSYSSSYSNSRRYNAHANQGPPYDPVQMDRSHGQPYQHGSMMGRYGQPYNQGQMRRRAPSDGSLGQYERMPGMSRHSGRSPSPAYYTGPGDDVPPMPRVPPQYMAAEQRRMLNPSMGGSTSSRSTNVRTDSDTPSSDIASPPTPQDGVSIEMFISPNGTRVPVYTQRDHPRDGVPQIPQYYDYSEQFENEQYPRSESDQVQAGIETQIKPIMEQQAPLTISASQSARSLGSQRSIQPTHASSIAEVPSSPIHQRITRDMILKATESTPTSGTMETLATASVMKDDLESPHASVAAHHPANEHIFHSSSSSSRPGEYQEGRQRSPSRAGSSVQESSTLDFAVRGSMPITAGTCYGTELSSQANSESELPVSPHRSTKDGFSDVLAGYQQTEPNHGNSAIEEARATPKKVKLADEQLDKQSKHVQKSSEAQSFRSATDILSNREPSVKDSDAHSFTTCEDSGSPDRAASMPPPRLLSSSLAGLDRLQHRPASEMSLAVPSCVLRKPLPGPSQDIGVVLPKDLASSKSTIQQNSSNVLSMAQQPPPVPPRGSSSSKEAQNSYSVSSFLMRQLPSRFTRGRKRSNKDGTPGITLEDTHTHESTKHTADPQNPVSSAPLSIDDTIQSPEKVLSKQEVTPERQVTAPLLPEDGIPMQGPGFKAASPSHRHALSSPSPDIPQPSSIYSPEDSPVRSRVRSSQPGVPTLSEQSRPDSQTTTHLDWHGGRSFNGPLVCADESPIRSFSSREGSTTDLRLSDYRYAGVFADRVNHLPQLREESHEDSSLNTSASNLMHSRFRLPFTAPGGVRASVEDTVVVSRSSVGSHQYGSRSGAQAQPCGLPSMDFSEMNLVHKLNEVLGLPKEESNEEPPTKALKLESPESTVQPPVSPRELREEYNSVIAELDGVFRKSGESVPPTTAMNLVIPGHTLSLTEYKAEIDRVRVPSVSAVSERVTKLLSSMRQYSELSRSSEFVKEEGMLEQALGDIHDVGVGSLVTKRSFARLRPVPGSPTMIVVDDAVFEGIINREKENGTPRHRSDEAAKLSSGESGSNAKGEGKSATHTTIQQNSSSSGLGRPSPAVLRPRALTTGHPELRAAPENILSSAQSVKSIVSEPTVTNPYPWRSDKNFPWEDSAIPSIDIALPSITTVKHSPRPGPSHLRNTLSDASFESSFSSANTATGSRFGAVSDSNIHAHHHRFSNFGRAGDQPHAVGERYPTSALTPPTAIFRDHSSAFDSSDDEDFSSTRKPKLGLIKRFSSARNGTLDNKPRGAQGKTNRANITDSELAKHSNDSIAQDRSGEAQAFNSHRLTFRNAEGMRPVDYRRAKIYDKFKRLWEKGASLIRTLSGRKQPIPTTA